MAISKRHVRISLLVLAGVMIQIGCGKKGGHRQAIGRLSAKPTVGGGQQTPPAGTAQSQQIESIRNQFVYLESGAGISDAQLGTLLGEGEYSLKNVYSTFYYLAGASEYVSNFQSPVSVSGGATLTTPNDSKHLGLLDAAYIDQGLQIEVPLTFHQAGDGSIARTASTTANLSVRSSNDKVEATFLAANAAQPLSAMNLLARTAEAPAGTTVRYLNVSGSSLRVHVDVTESAGDGEGPTVTRTFLLDYSFTPKSGQTEIVDGAPGTVVTEPVNVDVDAAAGTPQF